MSWTPFFLKRIGPRGPDTHEHLFCVGVKANPELVRTGDSDGAEVLVSGAGSNVPSETRAAVAKLVDALNAVFQGYLDGRFHEDPPSADDRVNNGIYKCEHCQFWTLSPSWMSKHERENVGHTMKFHESA